MYYIDKLGISHFEQWCVPNSLMAASNHIVAATRELGTQWHQCEIPRLSISIIPTATSNLCSQAAGKRCLIGRPWDVRHSRYLTIKNSCTLCSIKQRIAQRARGWDNLLCKMIMTNIQREIDHKRCKFILWYFYLRYKLTLAIRSSAINLLIEHSIINDLVFYLYCMYIIYISWLSWLSSILLQLLTMSCYIIMITLGYNVCTFPVWFPCLLYFYDDIVGSSPPIKHLVIIYILMLIWNLNR